METFYQFINQFNWDEVKNRIYQTTSTDVKRTLSRSKFTLDDFGVLISPAALSYLEHMAMLSKDITRRRFGKTIQLYVPLYLSNKCTNACIYCGFNRKHSYKRTTLNTEQIIEEAQAIQKMGFRHILLVTGEHPECGFEYLKNAIQLLRPMFSQISIEVAPMETEQYQLLKEIGLNSVYIYQETYNQMSYPTFHPAGKKSDYRYRLETPDRIGQAGIYRIGVGCLLGLDDWRTDSWFTALHVSYLSKKYWSTRYSISLPRLRPMAGEFQPISPISDKELLQLICAYRIVFEDVEISLSTRESAQLRDLILPYGITNLSAGSRTYPGGYANAVNELAQFEIGDARHPALVARAVEQKGLKPVWKDWDKVFC